MITVALLLVCCSLVEVSDAASKCFNCTGATATVSDCFDNQVICGEGQSCYVKKYLVGNEEKFDRGCRMETLCSAFITDRQAATELWEYCCKGDFCNRNDEGPLTSGRLPQLPLQLAPRHSQQRLRPLQRTLKISPKSHEAYTHDIVSFTCMIEPTVDTPVKMSWRKKDSVTKVIKTLSTQRVESGGFPLLLHDVTPSDAGEYVCGAERNGKMMTSAATLTVKSEKIPTIKVSPTSTTANIGESVPLKCAVSGLTSSSRITPTLTWYQEGKSATDRSTLLSQQASSGELPLNLVHVTGSSAGVYVCEAVIGDRVLSTKAHLKINDNAYIKVSPTSTTANFGDTVSFYCAVGGSPASTPTLTWYHVGERAADRSTLLSQQASSGELQLDLVHVTGSSAGYYVCEAVIGDREIGAKAYLKINEYFSMPRATPEIIYAVEGERHEILCEASGYPIPQMKLDIRPAGSSSFYTIEPPEPTTRITEILYPISRKHQGTYTCIAQNSVGRGSMKTDVKLVPKFSVS